MSKSLRFAGLPWGVAMFLLAAMLLAAPAAAGPLKVMKRGLGSGTVTSSVAGINCGADCDETYGSTASVTLTASPAAGSIFSGWSGDCSGTSACTLAMSAARSVRAEFSLAATIPILTDFTPEGIRDYLGVNPTVTTTARFIKALPIEYKRNWILMSRSESLQTGVAELPRILLPSADARYVFTVGLARHSSYPGAHPNAVEFMQWDPADKNFRFHEIVLDAIPAIGGIPARVRGVSFDDSKCSKCHSTRNVLDRGSTPGTTGIPPGIVAAKSKPNWDTYDSWGGMLPFNRDRIYQGSVEAAAFRKIFNPWTWRSNDAVRSIIEQLELQPPGVPPAHVITRTNGGANDGQVNFAFDASPPVLSEPAPSGPSSIPVTYSFNGAAGAPPGTSVTQGGSFVTLHHSDTPTSDEGRGVQLFDLLGGADGSLNQQRIGDELTRHRFATGSFPIDVRPIALAITKRCVVVNAATNTVTSDPATPGLPALSIGLGFFDSRNGMTISQLVADTATRAQSLPRRKADIQKMDADRSVDPYLLMGTSVNGLVQQYGAATAAGTTTSLSRLRQEVLRRPIDAGVGDSTVMGGVYVDRELYAYNTERLALYRYFLEPLGVSVDKWSMGVRGRSRTYTFADVFGYYDNILQPALEASLGSEPVAGLSAPYDCADVIPAVNRTLSALPAASAVPTFTDVQRIFNKGCIECHGGLGYPPYANYGTSLDLSEDESPPAGGRRLSRSYGFATGYTTANPSTSLLYLRLVNTSEACPSGMMPCGGPALSKADIETIRRWIVGGRPATEGDPHVMTVDGVPYDFQSAGEFVLLRDEGLEIQARQTPVQTEAPLGPNAHTGLSSCVSINTAVALRVGMHRITYQPNIISSLGEQDPSGLLLRIDGKVAELVGRELPLATGERIVRTTAPGGIQVESPGGTVVVITPAWWDYYQLWYLNIDTRNARATEGVIGAIAPGNWLPALPDGTLMGPRPASLHQRYVDLYEKFANAWRVSDATTLFDYAPGTSSATFTVKGWPAEAPKACTLAQQPGGPIAKEPQKPLLPEEAQKLCGDIVATARRANCAKDVGLTGEAGFAKAYLLTEQIERNAMPTTPALLFPGNFKSDLADTVTFTWKRSSDKDGSPLTYRHCLWIVSERQTYNNCQAVSDVEQTPTLAMTVAKLVPGRSYFWKVIAEDGMGGMTESETRRFTVK